MRRRVTLLILAVAVALILAGGVALAATLRGTDGRDNIVGTDEAD
ncbi:MAG: hypothetical protein ACRDTR_15120 [Rubrobacter sp.]